MDKTVMSRQQVRSYDERAIKLGVPSVVLMENAGRGCAEIIKKRYKIDGKVAIICGAGNNGGDGFVISRHLRLCGIDNKCFVLAKREKIKGDANVNLRILENLAVDICMTEPESLAQNNDLFDKTSLIVDAIFGTGLEGDVRERYLSLFSAINNSGIAVFAVDIPSGLDCDSGVPHKAAIKAEATATFVAMKKGFQNPQAKAYTGEVFVTHIGV